MNNYVEVCGRKVPVDAEKLAQVKKLLDMTNVKLAEIPAGGTFVIGNHEMVVLEQFGDAAAVIQKDLLKESKFGCNNNFDGSTVDGICREFAKDCCNIVRSILNTFLVKFNIILYRRIFLNIRL